MAYSKKSSHVPEYANFRLAGSYNKAYGPADPFAKFRERVRSECVPTSDGCLLWTGAKWNNGYGAANFQGSQTGAHRIAYMSRFGSIPEGLEIDHICEVRNCVQISHLQAVTHVENMDLVMKRAGKPASLSGHRYIYPRGNGYIVKMSVAGEKLYLGSFITLEAAKAARDSYLDSQVTHS